MRRTLPAARVVWAMSVCLVVLNRPGLSQSSSDDPLGPTRTKLAQLSICLKANPAVADLQRGLLTGWLRQPTPAPSEYLDSLDRDLSACAFAATVTDQAKSQSILDAVLDDVKIKADDCLTFGMGRLVPVQVSTLRGSAPENGWAVFYKWSPSSQFDTEEMRIPQLTSPASKALPPGKYSIRAEKQSLDSEVKKIAPRHDSGRGNSGYRLSTGNPMSDLEKLTAKNLRIGKFANFFKSYMNVSTLVAASIPIPITSWKLIPIFSQQKTFLTIYTSLFCFLVLAFVFSVRHRLCVSMFSPTKQGAMIAYLPFLFIIITLLCILGYHATLQRSLQQLRDLGVENPTKSLLDKTDYSEIPNALPLAAYYLGIFVFAEAAFVLMAIREYLQDVLHLDEIALLSGKSSYLTQFIIKPQTSILPPLEPESRVVAPFIAVSKTQDGA